LISAGFRDEPHQLPALHDALGRGLDLHVHVPDLRLERSPGPATFAALRGAGLLERTGLPGECFVPCPPVLTAHLVVHALTHHGFAPHAYPQFRLVGDLLDLGAAGDDGELTRAALPFVEHDVTAEEMGAAVMLARRLGKGDAFLFERSSTVSSDELLLRHLVAGVLDEDYHRALRWRGHWARGRQAESAGGALAVPAREAWRALFVTDAQIDVIYGRPRSRFGYVARRLARPFDLVRRAVRLVVGSFRLRLRR
jgi:hypothetical protein